MARAKLRRSRVPGVRAGLHTLLFTVCIAACAAAPQSPEKATSRSGAVRLVRGAENHLLARGAVNGTPATFLIDTGSAISFLQNDRAERFGVRRTEGEARSSGRGFPVGAVEDLRLGPISLGRVDFALFDPAQFRGPVPGTGGKAADGIIGLDLLRRYGAVINCRTQQLFFAATGARDLNLAATARAHGFLPVQMQPTLRGFVSAPCNIGSKAGALAVDTGAFVTVFDQATVNSLQLERAPSTLTARTAGGRVRALELARIEDLRIGGVKIPPQRFAVMDMFPKKQPLRTYTGINKLELYDARALKARLDIWGLLGSELLYQHHAIIDLDRMALYLK